MYDYDTFKKYQTDRSNRITKELNKLSELIAYIRVYSGAYYFSLILNLNNVKEHYLENLNSELIDQLYEIYLRNEHHQDERETFEQLRSTLEKLPAFTITEVTRRRERHKHNLGI